MRIQSMAAQTIGSQFPLVPMVNVKGLNSQAITDHTRIFSGIPRSFRMVSMNNPTSKSAEQIIIYDHQKVYQGKYSQKKRNIYRSAVPKGLYCNYCFSIKSSFPKLSASVWPRKKDFWSQKKKGLYCIQSKCHILQVKIKITG